MFGSVLADKSPEGVELIGIHSRTVFTCIMYSDLGTKIKMSLAFKTVTS